MWTVNFYEKEDGSKPAQEFIHNLDIKLKAKAYKEIEILEEFGTQIKMPYSRPMQDGIFELRIQSSNNLARVFYFFVVNKKIILTNGFIKKTPKTPPSEIQKALEYKADYERRYLK